jgi:hypothetical protein
VWMRESKRPTPRGGRASRRRIPRGGRAGGEKVDQVCVSTSYFLGVEIAAVATEQEETH